MNGSAWAFAFIWYFIVQLASRLLTSADMNVNLSQRVQDGWEGTFPNYLKFWLLLSALVGICIWFLGLILQRLWPALRPHSLPSASASVVEPKLP